MSIDKVTVVAASTTRTSKWVSRGPWPARTIVLYSTYVVVVAIISVLSGKKAVKRGSSQASLGCCQPEVALLHLWLLPCHHEVGMHAWLGASCIRSYILC